MAIAVALVFERP